MMVLDFLIKNNAIMIKRKWLLAISRDVFENWFEDWKKAFHENFISVRYYFEGNKMNCVAVCHAESNVRSKTHKIKKNYFCFACFGSF